MVYTINNWLCHFSSLDYSYDLLKNILKALAEEKNQATQNQKEIEIA